MLSSSFALHLTTNLRQTARTSAHARVLPHTCTWAKVSTLNVKKKVKAKAILRTLRPDRIVETGQEIIDLSGKCAKTVRVPLTHPRWPSALGPRVLLQASADLVRTTKERFPDDTRGFFYYHRGVPALAGGVRFRVCDDAAGFDAGRDLELRSGLWQAQPLDVARVAKFRGFIPLLLQERLVDEDLLADAAKIKAKKRYRFYSFSDPFLFSAKSDGFRLHFITRKGSNEHRFTNPLEDTRDDKPAFPYTGRLWACFEISKMPEHAKKGPCLLLRCLEIVQPIECVVPGYDGHVYPPSPGEYVMRNGRPWYHRLLRQEEKFRDMMEQEGIYPSAEECALIVIPRPTA
ncbi:hypothetical protein HYPSUDRAFT_1044507 [Hypholoma sublateritium FD-334 SS-4]|uniref:Uncharacterized protein n=1 Tax=Hypholoma sublateritium (strain FD-334 SS-4) TaxID=945553 RepID=A0A0D2KR52_HYPSF|nr:hypothetical protein HYPSUDRAFT_1044507 [Hypholoma sublateritium FD-334 SS-4]